uniref:Secreted protein n=1 Tax=Opuntia streptacantha TaxID=393608 RepID=A0A7C9AP64_OPUST
MLLLFLLFLLNHLTFCLHGLSRSSHACNHRITTSGKDYIPYPLSRGIFIWLPMFIQLPLSNQLLLHCCPRPKAPFPGISIPVHNHPLDFRHHSMITSSHDSSSHLRNTQRNRLPLCGHQNNLLPDFNIILKPKKPRNHQLSTITDSIHS